MSEKTTSTADTPTKTRKKRIVGIDGARGLALIGMIAIHVMPDETVDGEPTLIWTVGAGVAAALFSFLAGVSLSLNTGGRTPQGGRALNGSRIATAVRAVLLIVLGMLLAVLNPPAGIILAYYGVMFLMAIPLLGASRGLLWALTGVAAVVGSIFVHFTAGNLPSLDGFDPTLGMLVTHPDAVLGALLVSGTYPALAWMAFMTAGMAVGRLNLSLRDTQLRLMVGGLIAAVVTWATSTVALSVMDGYTRILMGTPELYEEQLNEALIWGATTRTPEITSGWWLFATSPYSETPVEMLNMLGWAVAAFGVMLFLGSKAAWLLRPLALLGTMTLTLYSLHLIFISTPLLASVPALSFWVQAGSALLFVILWRNTTEWSQGPLEWVLATSARWARSRYLESPATS